MKLFGKDIERQAVIGAVLGFAVGCGFSVVVWSVASTPPTDGAVFDAAIWRKDHHNTSTASPRYRMLDHLRARYLRHGMGRAEVLGLLGMPDSIEDGKPDGDTRRIDEARVRNAPEMTWFLGTSSGFGIDIDRLVITFDKAGGLSDVAVRRK